MYSDPRKIKNLYRSYNISKPNWGNDIGSMRELIERRFEKSKDTNVPSLVIVDGGKTTFKEGFRGI